MDIPLPEESQPPGLPDGQFPPEFPVCDNIPLPSCGIQFNTAFPPPFPAPAMPVIPPVLPTDGPPPHPPPLLQLQEGSMDQVDDPNRYSPSRAIAEDDLPASPPPPPKTETSSVSRSNSSGAKTTVLGKAQAKKRLLAFSMTKQGGGAGLSFGFQKKLAPKVNTGSAKLFAGAVNEDEVPTENKEIPVKQEKPSMQVKKKASKKSSSREDKARAVVSAIEEIKREELMLRGAMIGYDMKSFGEMTAPVPLLMHPLQLAIRQREENSVNASLHLGQHKGEVESLLDSILAHSDRLNNERGGHSDGEGDDRHERRRDDRKRDSGSSRRRSDRRSKERHSRSGKDRHKSERRRAPTELPTSWAHFRSGGYRMEEMRRLKLKLDDMYLGGSSTKSRRDKRQRRSGDRRSRSNDERRHRRSPPHDDRKTEEELDHVYRPFDGPPRLRFPLLITNSKQMIVEYPRSFIRYTKSRPIVSYSEHPESQTAHLRSRREIMSDAAPEIIHLMNEIINSRKQEEQIQVKHEPGENLSSSLTALQVSYDEAEVGSPLSQDNIVDNKRKERLWFPEKDYLLSTELEEKDESSMTDAEVALKSEKEDLELERDALPERKMSMEAMDAESDHRALSNSEQDKEKSPEIDSVDEANNVLKAERMTVRSKWDSDYEEDVMSTEDNKVGSNEHTVAAADAETNNRMDVDFSAEDRQNMSRDEFERDSETQEDTQVMSDEESQKEDLNETNVASEESKDVRRDEDDEIENIPVNDFPMQMEEVNTMNVTSVETSNEGNADQKLVSEYEEFMKAVSFDTALPDEQTEESGPQEENVDVEKDPSEKDIFERRELDIQLNNMWDEDSKERIEEKGETEEIDEQVSNEFMLLEKVIRDRRRSGSRKKKKKESRSRSSSSSSEDEENIKMKKRERKRKSKTSEKGKKENKRKSFTSDGSSSSDESSTSSSEGEHDKKKHVSKKEKSRKKIEETADIQTNEIIQKIKPKYKKASKKKKKKKKKTRKKKQQRKRSKKRKVESSSSSEDSSDSDDDSSSSKSDKGFKHRKVKESKARKKEESSSDDSSSSSSSSTSSSSSSSHARSSRKRKRKSSKKLKKEIKKKKKDRSKKKKKRRHDSSSDMDGSIEIKTSKLNSNIGEQDGKLNNGNEGINFDELQEEVERRMEDKSRSLSEERSEFLTSLSNRENNNSDVSRSLFQNTDGNSSAESCWEDAEKSKRKRKKCNEDDGAVNDIKRDSDETRREKIFKKRRRERRSHSSSPLNDLNRKRRRSPSTSPEHSPTPQRRSSTETKDKGRKDSDASNNQTNSGHRLNRSSGEGHRRGHNQDDLELAQEDFDCSELKQKCFDDEEHSGFESCADDVLREYKARSSSKHFSSSDEEHFSRNTSNNLSSHEENTKRNVLEDCDSEKVKTSEKDEINEDEQMLLTEVKQELISEDENLTNQNSSLSKDNNFQSFQNIESDGNSKIQNEIDVGTSHFDFPSDDKEIPVKNEEENNEMLEAEDSGSIYSPGDPFDCEIDSDFGKKNICDYLDSSSQNSDGPVCSPVGSITDSIMNANSPDSSPSFSNMKVIDQWSSCDSPSEPDKPRGDTLMSLENIPLPPTNEENVENKEDDVEQENSNKSEHFESAPPPTNIPEDVHTQTDDSNRTFSSPLPDPGIQRKAIKISMQKHSNTVKLMSPLARLHELSENKSDSTNSSNIFEDIKDLRKEEENKIEENVSPDGGSKLNEEVKDDSDVKVQIKHPWKSVGLQLKTDSTTALYDDLIETSTVEQQVSSTTLKPVPVLNMSEKNNSGEAIAKERVRKRPSRWGMMTPPAKSEVEDLQQDDAITSQQKPEELQQQTALEFDKNKCNENRDNPSVEYPPFQSDKSHRRKSSESSSHSEGKRRDSESQRTSRDRHSKEGSRKDRGKERERVREKSEDGDLTREIKSEDVEHERGNRGENWERGVYDEGDINKISNIAKEDESYAEYRQYNDSKVEAVDPHRPSDWKEGDAGWEEKRDYSKITPTVDTPWESRVVHYRSGSRSLSPEFKGWDETAVKKARDEEWRGRYEGQERQDVERRDDNEVRESNRDYERPRDREKGSRDRIHGESRERMRESSRDHERVGREHDRERDRMRDHDKLRESSRERIHENRERDRLRDSGGSRSRERDRGPGSRDRDRMRDDRRIRDRWNDGIERSRERDRDRRGERRWDRDRRDRKRTTELEITIGIELDGTRGEVARSLADSTISDSELVAAAAKQDEHHSSSPFQQLTAYYNAEHYPEATYTQQEECNASPTISPTFSPKRISLDDRIELELGVKKSPPPVPAAPQQIPVYHQHQMYAASYSGYESGSYYPVVPPYETNDKVAPEHHYVDEFASQSNKQFVANPTVPSKRRTPLLPTPPIAPDMSHWDTPEAFIGLQDSHKMVTPVLPHQIPLGQQMMMPSEGYVAPQQIGGSSQVVQVGNVLQVVPADLPAGSIVGALPPPPPPAQQPPSHKSMVLQTGNVLQVIPILPPLHCTWLLLFPPLLLLQLLTCRLPLLRCRQVQGMLYQCHRRHCLDRLYLPLVILRPLHHFLLLISRQQFCLQTLRLKLTALLVQQSNSWEKLGTLGISLVCYVLPSMVEFMNFEIKVDGDNRTVDGRRISMNPMSF
ncbi:hypothetical protein L9F63_013692, partial [Diploptera punctata]